MVSEFKSKSRWRRIPSAFRYSVAGLTAAWQNEHAFRQELAIVVPGSIVALLLPLPALHKLLLIVELLNSAIEAAVDRVSLDRHPLSKTAKDFGSAAVLLAFALALATWAVIVLPLAVA